MLHIDATDGLPDSLHDATPVWEYVFGPSSRKPLTASRLYANGMVYSWANKRMALQPGSSIPSFEAAPWAWRAVARLDEDGVQAVRDEISNGGFASLDTLIEGRGRDQRARVWRGQVGETVHEVHIRFAKVPTVITSVDHTMQRNVIPGGVPIGP